jgi:hypothetical protein
MTTNLVTLKQHVYSLAVLKVISKKSRFWEGCISSRGCKQFLCFGQSGGSPHSLAHSPTSPFLSLLQFSHTLLLTLIPASLL